MLYLCEKCNKPVDQNYGSGRFCSRSCANSRIQTADIRAKISKSVTGKDQVIDKFIERINKETNYSSRSRDYECQYCGKMYLNHRDLKAHITKQHVNKEDQLYKMDNGDVLNVTVKFIKQYKENHHTCEICGKQVDQVTKYSGKGKVTQLCIDHDHNSNRFRGLLCQACNRQLGWYEKYSKDISKYINKIV